MNIKHLTLTVVSAILILSPACASRQNDPLKNTRKLVKEGHVSLYNNGAFRVPQSSIYLIPPAPGAVEFAMEIMGLRARQAFLKSLKKASESVYIVSEGTRLSVNAAKTSRETGSEIADYIRTHSRGSGTLLMDRSMARGKNIIGDSWVFSKEILAEMEDIGERVSGSTSLAADRMNETGTRKGKELIANSIDFSKDFYKDRSRGAKKAHAHAVNAFVKGYLAVPMKLKNNWEAAGENLRSADLSDIMRRENVWREKWSGKSVDLVGSTVGNYTEDVKNSFSKAGSEFDSCYTTGIPLATLKAMRWVLKGLLWDAAIEPASKITSGGLGYVAVNCLAYPVMVIEEEGRALTRIAVDVTWNTSRSFYELVAPSAEASLAAVFGVVEYASGPLVAGPAAAGGTLAGVMHIGTAKAGSLMVKGSGAAAGKVTEYIGVPLAAAGVTAAGATVGVAVMGGGAASSGTVYLGGEAAAAGSDVFGNLIAGTTLVAGTAVSVAGGAAHGVYQLGKAVAVPAGYEVGGGVVLSYETMSQISAQAILAVADCSYLVLSLEGPRWVVYAVKGKLGKGDDLAPGTVVDLKKMQSEGEEIYNVPINDVDMKNVVSTTCKTLPEMNAEAEKQPEP